MSQPFLFSNAAGFTAWSSTRDPAQVFSLLETVRNNSIFTFISLRKSKQLNFHSGFTAFWFMLLLIRLPSAAKSLRLKQVREDFSAAIKGMSMPRSSFDS